MLSKFIKRNIIDPISICAIRDMINSNNELKKIWNNSLALFPDLKRHFIVPVETKEVEDRIRLLVAAETLFIKKEIDKIIKDENECSYADVGDSDGSVRLLLNLNNYGDKLTSVGVNLQKSAVEKIKSTGLNAICADALSLGDQEINYDIVSVFETLEHLPDPIGFLSGIKKVTNKKLIVSVPLIRRSRVGLTYISDKWPKGKKPTIENTHIFELSPLDWNKIFRHTGWKIDDEWKLMMFPSNKLSRIILQPYWRYISFEGFWFVSLYKRSEYSSRYAIE